MLKHLAGANTRLLGWAQKGSLWLARVGGILLFATVAMITINIVTRSLFGFSLLPSTEYSGYVLALCSSWAFAHALLDKAHIRIDVAYLQLPRAMRAALDILALLAFLLFAIVVGRAAWSVDRKSTRLNSSHGSNSYAVFCLK